MQNQCFAKNISFAFRFTSVSILFGPPTHPRDRAPCAPTHPRVRVYFEPPMLRHFSLMWLLLPYMGTVVYGLTGDIYAQ